MKREGNFLIELFGKIFNINENVIESDIFDGRLEKKKEKVF